MVSLNYWVLKELGHPWTRFPAGFASRPSVLGWGSKNRSATRQRFESEAAKIVADMSRHAPGPARAWVLKDVRFARTLPLWWPQLQRPVCIIPYRHPAEVASSSILKSAALPAANCRPPCLRTAPHQPAWWLQELTPRVRTPERSLGSLQARRGHTGARLRPARS